MFHKIKAERVMLVHAARMNGLAAVGFVGRMLLTSSSRLWTWTWEWRGLRDSNDSGWEGLGRICKRLTNGDADVAPSARNELFEGSG